MITGLLKKSLTKLKTKMSTSACITVLGTDGIYRSVYNHIIKKLLKILFSPTKKVKLLLFQMY